MTLAIQPEASGPQFALGAIGLSVEAYELSTPDLNAAHRSLAELMRQLGPGVLRLGGSSVDSSWWTEGGEQPPIWATSVVTPSALASLGKLLSATGWRAILGVDLGHFDPSRAASEAGTAERILGSHLLGFEIGNEPNAYGISRIALRPSTYDVGNYLQELKAYRAAMSAAVRHIWLYGPDLSSKAWLPAISAKDGASFVAVTAHYYPTGFSIPKGVCIGTPVPTALDLLSSRVREEENTFVHNLVMIGEVSHRETRISETNSTASCDTDGGPKTSPVFASALWSLDWSLRAASSGVSGLNFHGYFGKCGPNTVSPICAPSAAEEIAGRVIARPEYYGLLAARQLEGGHFIPVHLGGQANLENLTAYATQHPDGEITAAIDNLSATESAPILLDASEYKSAKEEPLTAPSLEAKRGVTFGHASINIAGLVQPQNRIVSGARGVFRLQVSPASAMIVTLRR